MRLLQVLTALAVVVATIVSTGIASGAGANVVVTMSVPSTSVLDTTGCSSGTTYSAAVLADSPISYWRLGEQAGTNAVDEQGNATATYSGPYTLGQTGAVPGSSNTALQTVGGTGGGTAAITGLDVLTGAGAYNTVAFWMYWDGVGNVDPFAFHEYSLWFSSSTRFGFNTANGDVYGIDGAAVSALANRWVHVVAVFRNNGQVTSNKLYLDGQLQTLSQLQGTPNPAVSVTTNANISGTGWTNQYRFGGRLDEVAVYTGELSAARVATQFAAGAGGHAASFGSVQAGGNYLTSDCIVGFGSTNSTAALRMYQADSDGYAMTGGRASGVVGHWSFNETLVDHVGGNTAVIGGGTPTYAVAGHDPGHGDAMQFDGASRISIADTPSQRIDTFAVDLWFRTASIANNATPTLVSKGTAATNRNYGMWFDSGACACLKAGLSIGGVAIETTTPAAPLTTNTWRHAAMTYDGSALVLYVDGVEMNRVVSVGNPDNPVLPIGVGQRSDGTGSFLGQVDEVRVSTSTYVKGMFAGAIPDYGGGIDWTSPSMFGVCLRTTSNATAAWTAGPSSSCPSTSGAYWQGIPESSATASNIATTAVNVVNGAAVLNFGVRVSGSQAPGSSSAPIVVEVVAPAA